jgi:DNA-binding LacI/PurR family transcriptional regulator
MISEVSFPMLSTITQDFEKMGMITTDSIIDKVEGKNNGSADGNLLPVSLLVRESVSERANTESKGVK